MRSIIFFYFLLHSYFIQAQTSETENGWYKIIIDSAKTNFDEFIIFEKYKIIDKPIISVQDIVKVEFEKSKTRPFYQIVLYFNEDAKLKWKIATSELIGQKVGFYYDNELISIPMITNTIESGKVSIGSDNKLENEKLFNSLKKDISKNK